MIDRTLNFKTVAPIGSIYVSAAASASNSYGESNMFGHAANSSFAESDKTVAAAQIIARLLACDGNPTTSSLTIEGTLGSRAFTLAFTPMEAENAPMSGYSQRDQSVLRNGMLIALHTGLNAASEHIDLCLAPRAISETQIRASLRSILRSAVPDVKYGIEVLGYFYSVTLTY